MKRVVIYARYSSALQNERSADDQIALCRDYAERQDGWTVVGTFDDRAMSGASVIGRMGLERMMKAATSGLVDVVLVESVDRIGRDQGDISTIRKKLKFAGVQLVTVSDGAVTTITAGMRGMFAEMYLDDLRDKTRRGLQAKVKNGQHAGGRSFGYRPIVGQTGALEIVEDEAAIVREIFGMAAAGRSSRHIAQVLNARGTLSPRGTLWTFSTIQGSASRANGILHNELYIGRLIWNRQRFIKDPDTGKRVSRLNDSGERVVTEAPHLRIVSDDLWQAVNARPRQARGTPQRRQPATMLSGLMACGHCGHPYIANGDGRIVCTGYREKRVCTNKRTFVRSQVEDRVIDGIQQYLCDPELIREYVAAYTREMNAEAARSGSERNALTAKRDGLRIKAKRLVGMIADGMGGATMALEVRAIEDQIADIEAQLAAAPKTPVSIHPNAAERFKSQITEIRTWLASADDDVRLQAFDAIRALTQKVTIWPIDGGTFELDIAGDIGRLLEIGQDAQARRPVETMVAGARNSRDHSHILTFRVA